MNGTRRMLAAAIAGAFAVSGGAYVVTAQIRQAPAQAPAQTQVAQQPQAQAEDLEQFEGRLVDVVRFVRGEDQDEAADEPPAEFGAPLEDQPGGGLGQPAPPAGDAPADDRQTQRPAMPPQAFGQPGPEGPVGLVKRDGENGDEQLYVLGIDDTAGPAQRGAPAPLPAPRQQQGEPEQQAPPIDIPGGGFGQPAQQPAEQPAEPVPGIAEPGERPGAAEGRPVRSQADLERHLGEEVTIHGKRHERAGVEVVIVHRVERDAAAQAPAGLGEPPARQQQPEQTPAPIQQPEQSEGQPEGQPEGDDGDDDGGFDFDW